MTKLFEMPSFMPVAEECGEFSEAIQTNRTRLDWARALSFMPYMVQ
jgi:hypothetical protein